MKRTWILATILLFGLVAAAWSSRGFWRDRLEEARKPALPVPAAYVPEVRTPPSSVSPTSTGTVSAPTPSPEPKNTQKASPTSTPSSSSLPLPTSELPSSTLPSEVNLAVPFLPQAPKQNWDMPYQEACEEASLIMADAYFSGRTKKFEPEEGDRAILDLVAFEERRGLAADITAEEAKTIIPAYFSKRQARVLVRPTKEALRSLLARGIPIIVPADGKALQNPNFRNGGPKYHMLILKGYLPDGRWITNDPGTRKGADYLYDQDILWNAIRDWNGGDVKSAIPMVIVMEPIK